MSGNSSQSLQALSRPATSNAEGSTTVSPPASRWKTRVLLPAIIAVAVIVMLAWSGLESLLPAEPVRTIPVVVKTVEGQAGTVTVQAPGWLEPDPHPYYAAALADGVVEEVLVLEGEPVEAGQVVARMVNDDAELELKRADAELQQAQAELEIARAEQKAARTTLERLVDRRRDVAAAEARIAEIDAELKKLEADVAAASARLDELQDEYDRKSTLVESRAVSEASVARLALQVQAQRAAVDAVKAQRPVLEAKRSAAQADHEAAVEHVELLIEEHRAVDLAEAAVARDEARVDLASAKRDEAALRLERMEVRAPASGIVMRRLASPGSKLMQDGDELSSHAVHIYNPHELQVRVDVPLADAANVSVGQRAEVTVEVLPDRTFTGTLTRIVHQADIQKNTVEVKVAIDDPIDALKPDMLARVRFIAESPQIAGEVRQRIFAPRSLVQSRDGESVAMVVTNLVDRRGRVELRNIVTGTTVIEDWIEVTSGLQAGDLLVAQPPDGMEAGDRVEVVGEFETAGFGGGAL